MSLLLLEKWADNYRVGCDPRREDPLYYYMKDEEWDLAIGFEVNPLYEERRSEDVTVQVVSDHRAREGAMDEVARRTMYCRVIPCLVRRYSHWRHLTVCSKHFDEIMADGALADKLLVLGFGSEDGGVGSGPMWRETFLHAAADGLGCGLFSRVFVVGESNMCMHQTAPRMRSAHGSAGSGRGAAGDARRSMLG